MGRYKRFFLTSIGLSLFVLLSVMNTYAQPFGMMSQQPQKEPQHRLLSSANGRFVFGQISDSNKDQFMLDTFTGRLWRIAESGAIGIFLRTVPYRTKDGECSALPGNLSDSESKEVEKQ